MEGGWTGGGSVWLVSALVIEIGLALAAALLLLRVAIVSHVVLLQRDGEGALGGQMAWWWCGTQLQSLP